MVGIPVRALVAAALGATALLPGCLGFLVAPDASAAQLRLASPRLDAWAGEPVSLSLAVPNGTAVAWDLGNGTTREGNPLRHTFDAPGLYAVRASALGASLTFLVPVHWRGFVDEALEGPRTTMGEADPARIELPLTATNRTERVAASLAVHADNGDLLGAEVAVAIVEGAGRVRARDQVVLAAGGTTLLSVSLPGVLLAGEGPLRVVVEVAQGRVAVSGTLEVRTSAPY